MAFSIEYANLQKKKGEWVGVDLDMKWLEF
jgi:hypothetical protein